MQLRLLRVRETALLGRKGKEQRENPTPKLISSGTAGESSRDDVGI